MISISKNFVNTVVPGLTIATCPGLFVSPIYSFGGGGNSGVDVDVLMAEGADARLILIGQADRYGAAARLGVLAEVICIDDLTQPTPAEARAIVYALNPYAYTVQPGIDKLLDRLRVIAGLPSDTAVNAMTAHAERTEHGGPDLTTQAAPVEHIMQFFTFTHLPEHLQVISQPFAELAQCIVTTLPRNPERTVALRKLLESKDAAVRAKVVK